jgi:hypothetical protein
MNPMKRELDKFLKKDKENPNVFRNEIIKRQNRSKSLDQAQEYEMGPDEVAGNAGKQESEESESLKNPFM